MEQVRTALIGLGGQGKKYALRMAEGAVTVLKLTHVCVRGTGQIPWIRENLPEDVKVCVGLEELFADADAFDAVIVVTPHRAHREAVLAAARHGKHILCDKPLDVTVPAVRQMRQAAEEAGVKFAVIYQRRYFDSMKAIREMLHDGTVGEIRRIYMENVIFRTRYYHESGRWRSSWTGEGGGMLINQGQHIVDLWLWLFGVPESVRAEVRFGKYNPFDVDDESMITMNYPDGRTAHLFLSSGEVNPRGKADRLTVVGTKGKLEMIDTRLTVTRYGCDAAEYAAHETVGGVDHMHITQEVCEVSEAQHESSFNDAMTNFGRAILYGEPLAADGQDGENAVALANAAYLSGWTGRTVPVPPPDEEYAEFLAARERAEEERHAAKQV